MAVSDVMSGEEVEDTRKLWLYMTTSVYIRLCVHQ